MGPSVSGVFKGTLMASLEFLVMLPMNWVPLIMLFLLLFDVLAFFLNDITTCAWHYGKRDISGCLREGLSYCCMSTQLGFVITRS